MNVLMFLTEVLTEKELTRRSRWSVSVFHVFAPDTGFVRHQHPGCHSLLVQKKFAYTRCPQPTADSYMQHILLQEPGVSVFKARQGPGEEGPSPYDATPMVDTAGGRPGSFTCILELFMRKVWGRCLVRLN